MENSSVNCPMSNCYISSTVQTPLMDFNNEKSRLSTGLSMSILNTLFNTTYPKPTNTTNDRITLRIHGQLRDFISSITPARDRLNINVEDMVFDDQLKQVLLNIL